MREIIRTLRSHEGVIGLSLLAIFIAMGPPGVRTVPWEKIVPGVGDSLIGPWAVDFVWDALWGFALPITLIRAVLKEPLAEYGLGLGDRKAGLVIGGIGLAVGAASMWVASRDPAMRAEYPWFGHPGAVALEVFVAYELSYALYFLALEFAVRGYLLFGLRRLPPGGAVAVAAVVQTVFHLGQPWAEVLAAPVFGVVVGIINLRVRSIWYAWGVHWLINVVLDALITYAPSS